MILPSVGYGTSLLTGSWQFSPLAVDPKEKNGAAYFIYNKGKGLDALKADSLRAQVAWRRIINHPYEWILARLTTYPRLFIHNGEYFLTYGRDPRIKRAIAERDWYAILVKVLSWGGSLMLLFLMLYGLWRLWENKSTLFVFAVPILIVALLHVPVWIEPRYFIPFTPLADVLAAYGLFRLLSPTQKPTS